ncbi:MAG: ParB N-terminal domain-containing protein [Firmicutes bacterium]|nr:ParB N-terminal domain-containing protein [Bacillota bacterium]
MEMCVIRSNEEILSGAAAANKTIRKDVFQIDPKFLTVEEGHNVRDFETDRVKEHIETLAANIAENGVLTPLECRRETVGKDESGEVIYKYVIVDGECRYRAIRSLEDSENPVIRVPVILERPHNNEADRICDMLNANESLRFSPIELGTAYKKFLQLGWNETGIAQKLGKSVNHVKECLSLLGYDESVVNAVRTNKVSASNVRKLDKKVKEEGVHDDYNRKKEVSRRLEKAIITAEENTDPTKKTKLNVSKYLDIKQTVEERIVSAIDLLVNTFKDKDFTRDQLTDLAEDLRAGQSLQNAFNKIFGAPLVEEDRLVVNEE